MNDNQYTEHNISQLLLRAKVAPEFSELSKERIWRALRAKQRRQATRRTVTRAVLALAAGLLAVAGIGWMLSDRGEPSTRRLIEADTARYTLQDGSSLILHRGAYTEDKELRSITLQRGAALIDAKASASPLVVNTPAGKVSLDEGRFLLDIRPDETQVVAINGALSVVGRHMGGKPGAMLGLKPGEAASLSEKGITRRPMPRISAVAYWARPWLAEEALSLVQAPDLMISQRPERPETAKPLPLREFIVDVFIEGQMARVAIDQTFFNDDTLSREAKYTFPLPSDAAISRLAMYVDGTLMEAGIVEKNRGRDIYESIVHQQKDPALLEQLQGNLFQTRIFPLFARQEKRILLSYTQPLQQIFDGYQVVVPIPNRKSPSDRVRYQVRIKDGAMLSISSPSHSIWIEADGEDALITFEAEEYLLQRDFLLQVQGLNEHDVTTARATQGEDSFWMMSYMPTFTQVASIEPRRWVFLHDVSASRSELLRSAQVYLIERFLREIRPDDTFSVIAFDSKARAFAEPMLVKEHDKERLREFFQEQEGVGATNLQAAVEMALTHQATLGPPSPTEPKMHIVYLGDGELGLDAEQQVKALQASMKDKATFISVAVGDPHNANNLRALSEATDGLFTAINPTEDMSWRIFDLVSTLNTTSLTRVSVTLLDDNEQPLDAKAYPSSTSINSGEVLTIVAKTKKTPTFMLVEGSYYGEAWAQQIVLRAQGEEARYLPRLWAQLRIQSLLRESASEHEEEITALGMAHFLVTPFTSLLVLESDAMYQQFKVNRGGKDDWARYETPDKIEVKSEFVQQYKGKEAWFPSKQQRPLAGDMSGYRGKITTTEETVAINGEMTDLSRFMRNRSVLDGDFAELELRSALEMNQTSRLFKQNNQADDPSDRAGFAQIGRHEVGGLDLGILGGEDLANGLFQGIDGQGEGRLRELGDIFGNEANLIIDGKRLDGIDNISLLPGSTTITLDPGFFEATNARFSLNTTPADGTLMLKKDGWGDSDDEDGRFFWSQSLGPLELDPLQYVPGLFETRFDAERQVLSSKSKEGSIDKGAKSLLQKARALHAMQYTSEQGATLTLNTNDTFTLTQTLPSSLTEEVSFNGKTLHHLYRELGLLTRRDAKKLAPLVIWDYAPFFVPSAGALSARFDVKLSAEDTIQVRDPGDDRLIAELVFNEQAQLMMLRRFWSGEPSQEFTFEYEANQLTVKLGEKTMTYQTAETNASDVSVDESYWSTFELPVRADSYWHDKRSRASTDEMPYYTRQLLLTYWGQNMSGNNMTWLEQLQREGDLSTGDLLFAGVQNLERFGLESVIAQFINTRYFDMTYKYLSFAEKNPSTLMGMLAMYRGIVQRQLSATLAQEYNEKTLSLIEEFLTQYPESPLRFSLLANFSAPASEEFIPGLADLWALLSRQPSSAKFALFQQVQLLSRCSVGSECYQEFLLNIDVLLSEFMVRGGVPVLSASMRNSLERTAEGEAKLDDLWKKWEQEALQAEDPALLFGLIEQGSSSMLPGLVAQIKERFATKSGTLWGAISLLQARGETPLALELLLVEEANGSIPALYWSFALHASAGEITKATVYLEKWLSKAEGKIPAKAAKQFYFKLFSLYQQEKEKTDELRTKSVKAASKARGVGQDTALDVTLYHLWKESDKAEALRYLYSLQERAPMNAQAYGAVYQRLLQDKMLPEAAQMLGLAARVEATNPEWSFKQAQLLCELHQKKEAINALDQILEANWQERFRDFVRQANEMKTNVEQGTLSCE